MKATVEFEVNGCHDCVLCFTDTYEPIMYCTHPQKADNMPDTEKYVYKRTFPEWCPLVKVEEEQPEQITAPFYYIFECNGKTEHVMFDNIVLSGNQPDDKDRVKLNCDMEVSKDVFNGLIELQRRKTKNEI